MACGDEGSSQPCDHCSRPEGAMQVQAGIPFRCALQRLGEDSQVVHASAAQRARCRHWIRRTGVPRSSRLDRPESSSSSFCPRGNRATTWTRSARWIRRSCWTRSPCWATAPLGRSGSTVTSLPTEPEGLSASRERAHLPGILRDGGSQSLVQHWAS